MRRRKNMRVTFNALRGAYAHNARLSVLNHATLYVVTYSCFLKLALRCQYFGL